MTKPLHPEPHSYVVRVYRRTAQWLAGCVEDVHTGRVSPFGTPAELWAAIGGPHASTQTGGETQSDPTSPREPIR
jgi:hypothetical protein